MMEDDWSGFTEIEHTADWALKVWAPNLVRLFARAAEGMYWLMETRLEEAPRTSQALDLETEDTESLLVSFLSELLYLGESEQTGFDQFDLAIDGARLVGTIRGARLIEVKKEIKAVTYHHLEVVQDERGYSVTIVFDV